MMKLLRKGPDFLKNVITCGEIRIFQFDLDALPHPYISKNEDSVNVQFPTEGETDQFFQYIERVIIFQYVPTCHTNTTGES